MGTLGKEERQDSMQRFREKLMFTGFCLGAVLLWIVAA